MMKKESLMKKKLMILAGVAGMLMTSPTADTLAEVRVNVGGGRGNNIIVDRPPAFIRLASPGFSVSVGAPYDIVLSNNVYYLYDHGQWYRSLRYNGPWRIVRVRELPPRIRHYRIEQIRRFRDMEYNQHRDRYDREWHDNRKPDNRNQGAWDGPGRNDQRQMPPR
jgi:hypothetical protein